MEKLKNLKYLKWIIIAVVLVLVCTGVGFGINKVINNESKVTKLNFEDIGELATQSAYVTSVSVYDKANEFYGVTIPFTQSKYVYSYSTTIKAGFNFADILVDVDETSKVISVTLPEATILSSDIDLDSFKVYHESQSIFNPIQMSEYNDSLVELRTKAEQEAIDQGLLENAQTNGEVLVENFIGNVYDLNTYTVQFK